MTVSTQILEVADLLKRAGRVLFVTGAGISADSGLPTYRGVGGLYSLGVTEEGMAIETALSGPMLEIDPALTWKYLWQIGSACAGAKPNDAHKFIAKLEKEKESVYVLTQNVDGLHRAAGSQKLIEAHGHAFDLFCTECGAKHKAGELINGYARRVELPPRCPKCNGVVRPDVVLFEEFIPERVAASLRVMDTIDFQLVFVIGTSALFPYISRPIRRAAARRVPIIEVNPDETDVSRLCSHRMRAGAVHAVRAIQAAQGL
jgi:NAD-dependent deacetylase